MDIIELQTKFVAAFTVGPDELCFMGTNRIVFAPTLNEFFHTHFECTLCGYYTQKWSNMVYHCKFGTHRYFLLESQVGENEESIEMSEEEMKPSFKNVTLPNFNIPMKRVIETLQLQWDPLSQKQVLELFWNASLKPTESMLCELCQTECHSTLQYKLHINSFPHKTRVAKLLEMNATYVQPFLDPSTNKIYFVSLVDRTIAMDTIAILRSQQKWIGYGDIHQMTQLSPTKLVTLLYEENNR